jgi:hypothetical protein
MRALRRYFFALALWASGFFTVLEGQDLSLTRPGSLNFFHPFSYADEGNFTPFPFRASGYGKVGYDDNIFLQHTGARGSVYTELGLSAGTNIGDERTQLTGDLLAGIVSYWQRPGKKIDPDINLDLSFSYQFNERTVFDLASFLTYQAQPNIASGVGAPNVVATYLYTASKFSLGFQWTPRIATFTSYSLDLLYYDSQALGLFQDRFDHLISEELRYLLRPAVVVLCEYRFGAVQYLYNSVADSYSHYFLGGSDVMLGARLKFGFRAGAEFRHMNGPSQQEVSYPYAESTLTFLYRPESTIDWYNRYGLEQPDESQSFYRNTFRTGVKISHRIGGKTRAVAAAYYSHNEYRGVSPFTENLVEANLELTYQITRRLQLSAVYTFTRDLSDLPSRDYIRNRIYCGAAYAF